MLLSNRKMKCIWIWFWTTFLRQCTEWPDITAEPNRRCPWFTSRCVSVNVIAIPGIPLPSIRIILTKIYFVNWLQPFQLRILIISNTKHKFFNLAYYMLDNLLDMYQVLNYFSVCISVAYACFFFIIVLTYNLNLNWFDQEQLSLFECTKTAILYFSPSFIAGVTSSTCRPQ